MELSEIVVGKAPQGLPRSASPRPGSNRTSPSGSDDSAKIPSPGLAGAGRRPKGFRSSRASGQPAAGAAGGAGAADADARQAALDECLAGLEGEARYSYPSLVHHLMVGSQGGASPARRTFSASMDDIIQRLRAIAGADIYLADGRVFVRESLAGEFPELAIFGFKLEDAFVRAQAAPDVWLENQRFARTRILAPLRREVRRAGIPNSEQAVQVIRALIGLDGH